MNLLHLNEKEIDNIVGIYGYNTIASDMISLERQISDFRNKEYVKFSEKTLSDRFAYFFGESLKSKLDN